MLIVATAVGLELQVTWDVTSAVVLFPYVAVAVYCWVVPGWTVALEGRTCNDVMVFEPGKNCPQPITPSRIVHTTAIREKREMFGTGLSYHSRTEVRRFQNLMRNTGAAT